MTHSVATDRDVEEIARVVVVVIIETIMNPTITAGRVIGALAILGVHSPRVCPHAGVAFDGVVDTCWRPITSGYTQTRDFTRMSDYCV